MTYLDSPMAAFFPTVLTIFDFGQLQGEMGGGGRAGAAGGGQSFGSVPSS